jgi:hypothetical protein
VSAPPIETLLHGQIPLTGGSASNALIIGYAAIIPRGTAKLAEGVK